MSTLAVMLIAMGIADVCRRLTNRLWLPVAVAPIVVATCAALAGLWRLGDIVLLVLAAAASVGWVLLSGRAERTGEHEVAPLVLFGASPLGLVSVSAYKMVPAPSDEVMPAVACTRDCAANVAWAC